MVEKYELSNHLGNVLTTVSDKKIGRYSTLSPIGSPSHYYESDMKSASDYYPFGWQQSGRKYQPNEYALCFNGKEQDEELKGEGNSYDFGARIYDNRIGRWFSVDPVKHPYQSPYSGMDNSPICKIDPDRKDAIVIIQIHKNKDGILTGAVCIINTVTYSGLSDKQKAYSKNFRGKEVSIEDYVNDYVSGVSEAYDSESQKFT